MVAIEAVGGGAAAMEAVMGAAGRRGGEGGMEEATAMARVEVARVGLAAIVVEKRW